MYEFKFENEWEQDTWDCVCLSNEYQLPSRVDGWVIVDLGFHLGSFADICLRRGAARIVAVESDPRNFARATEFFSEEDRVTILNRAIWSQSGLDLSILQDPRLENSGGKQVFDEAADPRKGEILKRAGNGEDRLQSRVAKSITLRDLLAETGVEKVDFLKVDVEGAEVSVFESLVDDPETFAKISNVTVEWHGKERKEFVQKILVADGFTVEDDHPFEDPAFGHVGYLYAERK